MNNLGKNLAYLLKRFNTTQVRLAAFADVSQNSISNWINGISYPNAEALVSMHEYFGISIDALLLTDIEQSKIVTDAHVAEFKRRGKANKKGLGSGSPASKKYFKGEDANQTLNEPEAVMSQLKKIAEKLDDLKDSVSRKKG